jgi:alpha-N-acetylglucosaminidase
VAVLALSLIGGTAAGGAQTQAADPAAAVRDLAARVLPEHADRFEFSAIPADDGRDVFEIATRDGKVHIRGNTGVAMATGLNWYLKHRCGCHMSWCGDQLAMPETLPEVAPPVRRASSCRWRYFLNYCCFGYSLPWWDWPQWERLIDWMALNGVNMPLAVTGQEGVWQAVCRELGLSQEQIEAFLAGPPYLPFGWMGCLDGWGGPLPQAWIDRHVDLGRRILARQRELGMTPVLQGFTGHVPAGIAETFPDARLHRIRWIEWQTHLLDPLDPLYPKIARLFMQEQARRFGTSHLYAADTFIEMTPPSGEPTFLRDLSRAIYRGMAESDPEAVWVLQGWTFFNQRRFWTQPRIEAFLGAIEDERMVVLDLFCESTPMWNRTEAFYGKPWVWCNIQTFGRTVRLGGSLGRILHDLPAARQDPGRGRLSGIGFVNEGLDDNPVVYDLLFEMAWRDEPVDLARWLAGYSRHRYGRADADAEAAWQILADTAYGGENRIRSIVETVPTLAPAPSVPYSNVRLAEAWRRLLDAADSLRAADAYRFDLVHVARQVLANHAATLHAEVVAAYGKKDPDAFRAAGGRYLQLIRDLDGLLATRREFLLGPWLEDAKRWGTTPAERARFEWNARRILTLWGTGKAIRDYARRQWSGMLTGFYLPRWEMFLDAHAAAMEAGQPLDEAAFGRRLLEWENEWSDGSEAYPTRPRGDSVAVARRLWETYGEAVRAEGKP